MYRRLRWQIALAVGGALLIAFILLVVSNRAFVDRPAPGGTLVEALVGAPATFNPLLATQSSEVDLVRLLFGGLTRVDARGQIVPDLAASWTVSQDGMTYLFKLRDNLTWHDGEPVTADDVVFTAALAKEPRIRATKSRLAAGWENAFATAVDAHTVQITLTTASAPFLESTILGLLPSHLLADVPPVDIATHSFSTLNPIGTGPYQLEQPGGLSDARISLRRFDGHWAAKDGHPYLDRLVFQLYPTTESALAALGGRAVQAMGGVPGAAVTRLGETARFLSATRNAFTAIYLNSADVLFGDPSVRQALSLSLDRAGIVHDPAGVHDQGVPAVSPIPPGSWAYDAEVQPPAYNPDQAEAVLDTANWVDSDGDGVRDRDGKPLQFTLATSNDALLNSIAARAQADWKAVGVSVTVSVLDEQGMFNNLNTRSYQAMLFPVELPLLGYDPDPYLLWHSSQVAGGRKLNFAGFANPEADTAIDAGRSISPMQVDARRASYVKFQTTFAQEQPVLMLYHPVYTYAIVDPALGGVQLPRLMVEAADRFATLADWYVRTERQFVRRN